MQKGRQVIWFHARTKRFHTSVPDHGTHGRSTRGAAQCNSCRKHLLLQYYYRNLERNTDCQMIQITIYKIVTFMPGQNIFREHIFIMTLELKGETKSSQHQSLQIHNHFLHPGGKQSQEYEAKESSMKSKTECELPRRYICCKNLTLAM